MAQDPKQNQDSASGFGSPLALFRRLTSQTVASSFQTQSVDQFGGMVYNRSNVQLASLSTPLGANAVASGNRSTAVGAFANAREDSASAYGVYARAWGPSSLAFGDQSLSGGYQTIAIGPLANVRAPRSLGIGVSAVVTTSVSDAIAIGTSATANGVSAIAIGRLSAAGGTGDIVMGSRATTAVATSGSDNIVLGRLASVVGLTTNNAIVLGANARGLSNSVAIGNSAVSGSNQMVIGSPVVSPMEVIVSNGHLKLSTEGNGVYIKEQTVISTSATYGRVTLSGAGTAIIYSTRVSATSQIFLTPQNASGTAGSVSITTSTAGVKATVGSTSVADTRTIAWLLLESA